MTPYVRRSVGRSVDWLYSLTNTYLLQSVHLLSSERHLETLSDTQQILYFSQPIVVVQNTAVTHDYST